MRKLMLNLLVIFIVCSCWHRRETSDFHAASPNLQVLDTTGSELRAKELFKIAVTNFFGTGSIRKLPDGESTLRYLIPITLFVDSHYLYIPDRSRSILMVYDFSGKYVRAINLKIEDLLLHKLVVSSERNVYALDVNKGLFVIDNNLNVIYRDEKTIDFHIDELRENLYLENMMGKERAIIDVKGTLKSPLKIDYFSLYIHGDTLMGIEQANDQTFSIVTKSVPDLTVLGKINWDTGCELCVILPRFLTKSIILSSREGPSMDQISFIDGEIAKTYTIRYPSKNKTLISDESADYSYTGYFYFFDKSSGSLLSICTDKEYIRVYRTMLLHH